MSEHRRYGFAILLLFTAATIAVPAFARNRSVGPAAVTDIVAQLESFAQTAITEEKVPGMVFAVIKDDQVVYTRGYGAKTAGVISGPITEHTVFEVGSTTKAFTASLLAMLVEQGKLSWNDRVSSVLPDFAMNDPWVTKEMRVVDLVTQRSGMPPYALDIMPMIGWGRADIVRSLAYVEPASSFRNTFGYVNNLWLVAARVIEKVGGYTWEDAMNLRILGPLAMRETTVDPEIIPLLGDVSSGHFMIEGTATPIPSDWPYRHWIDVIGPAGNVRSTVNDMSRWARLHLNRGTLEGVQILKPETVDMLHCGRTFMGSMNGGQVSYALGWVREERPASTIVWHNGGTPGQHSIVTLYPAAGVGLVVLTNTAENRVPERMKDKLFELMYPPAVGAMAAASAMSTLPPEFSSERPVRAQAAARVLAPIPPLPLTRYTGDYENPAYGTFTVKVKDGGPVMLMGPRQVEGKLEHYSGNVFNLIWPIMPGQTSLVTFEVEPAQPASGFTDPEFGDVRGGWFGRRTEQ